MSVSFSGRIVPRLALLAVLALPLGACETISSFNPFAEKQAKSDIGEDQPADKLFNDGLARLKKDRYGDANKKFSELDKQYPYSGWSRRGLLLSTYSSYQAGDYSEAINSGRRYVQLYPSSPDAPYAQYLVGMSYFTQIPDVNRDQERSQKALEAMDELLRRWPKSEYADDAKYRVAVARDQLAGKEMEVGRYYLNQKNYTGAITVAKDGQVFAL